VVAVSRNYTPPPFKPNRPYSSRFNRNTLCVNMKRKFISFVIGIWFYVFIIFAEFDVH